MNIQATLNEKMEELRHRDPELHALLDKTLKDKSGKGDFIPLTDTNCLNQILRRFSQKFSSGGREKNRKQLLHRL